MSLYTIKKVPLEEVNKLTSFLDKYWKNEHALVKSRELLDFQHLNREDGCYNFLVAENKQSGDYDALIGFIPTSQYDNNLSANGDYWGAIWKIRDDVDNDEINAVGFLLWKKIFKLPHFGSYAAIGISNIAKKIYEISRIPVRQLSHYYVLNVAKSIFSIAGNIRNREQRHAEDTFNLKWIDSSKLSELTLEAHYRPYKSVNYMINRYAKHPIYKYSFLSICNGEETKALLIIRKVVVGSSCVLRIIDVLGKLEGCIYNGLLSILVGENAEYIDCYNYGISPDVFYRLGFSLSQGKDDLIIPNYFEPFEQSNVILEIGYKSDFDYVAFKGDSDQDRPNII